MQVGIIRDKRCVEQHEVTGIQANGLFISVFEADDGCDLHIPINWYLDRVSVHGLTRDRSVLIVSRGGA